MKLRKYHNTKVILPIYKVIMSSKQDDSRFLLNSVFKVYQEERSTDLYLLENKIFVFFTLQNSFKTLTDY